MIEELDGGAKQLFDDATFETGVKTR